MTFPLANTDIIKADDYNAIHEISAEILGLGDDGYGLALYLSDPIETTDRTNAREINKLISDVDIVKQHIDNVSVTTLVNYAVTGTTIVNTSTLNTLKEQIDYYLDDSRRYTCHPSQFLTSTVAGSVLFFYDDSTSTRVTPWGETTNTTVRSISHRLVASWPTRLEARYYFNQGSYLSWKPAYSNLGPSGLNDLNDEWAAFILWLNEPVNEYRYTRTEFVDPNYIEPGSTVTTYTSGTLEVSIEAIKSIDETQVEFNIIFANNATEDLIVVPSVNNYSILV